MDATTVGKEFLTTQRFEAYTEEDHETWSILYARRMTRLREDGSRVFLRGAEKIGLARDRVPDLNDVNRRLAGLTGWQAIPVTGFMPAREFFGCLAQQRFPTTIILRSRAQLDYLEEPDIFHDVFGHVPLHADPVFADFLQRFGEVGASAESNENVTRMARLFWFTVEFGLVKEDGQTKMYGSGLISSHADAAHALGPKCDRRRFSLDAVWDQDFEIDRFQDVLFIVDDFQELFLAVDEARARIMG
jgi:phenylalanine-4-hydroxylase